MTDLQCGMQIFHNGRPVQLLYKTDSLEGFGDTWKVRPLFVVEPDRTELFEPSDAISFVHTTYLR